MEYRRIVVIGSPGSGKSYLSRRIAAITGLPLIHLDNLYHLPTGGTVPRSTWIAMLEEMVAKQEWIIDGNYNATLELRFRAADLVIFLDVSRYVCFFRALRRQGQRRSDVPDHINGKINAGFLNLLKFIWRFGQRGKPRIIELHEKYPDTAFWQIKGRKAAKRLVADMKIHPPA